MSKLSQKIENEFSEHSHAPLMRREKIADGVERLVVGVPAGDSAVFSALIRCLEEPFNLLYVLHTPRGEGEPGRYQSYEMSKKEVFEFIERFSAYLGGDARHDIWARSQSSNGTVVWDRHNLIYAYGPIAEYESELFGIGFSRGEPSIPFPHAHHYRAEYDEDAKEVLAAIEWRYSELRPEDEQ